MMTTSQTATYKGRTYRCLFIGDTKHGRRAHLQFFDGSKDFWVDASLVSASASKSSSSRRKREDEECELCGRNKYTCGHCIGW